MQGFQTGTAIENDGPLETSSNAQVGAHCLGGAGNDEYFAAGKGAGLSHREGPANRAQLERGPADDQAGVVVGLERRAFEAYFEGHGSVCVADESIAEVIRPSIRRSADGDAEAASVRSAQVHEPASPTGIEDREAHANARKRKPRAKSVSRN